METEDDSSRFAAIAQRSPLQALRVLPEFLARQSDPTTRSRLLRTAALAARDANDLAQSNKFLDQAVEEAGRAQNETAATEALLTKSYNVFLQGDSSGAIALVGSLTAPTDKRLSARIGFQHATILARTGASAEAREKFQRSADFAEAVDDRFLLARVEKNLGMVAAESGDAGEAQERFVRARRLFDQLGAEIDVAFMDNNLGYAATNLGDLPEAFACYRRASTKLTEVAGNDFESRAGLCRALMSAGLFNEAGELADESAELCLASDNTIDGAEMKLLAAGAWLEASRTELAGACVRDAALLFEAQVRPGHQAAARLIEQSIRHRTGRPLDSEEVMAVIQTLQRAGLHRDATEAKLLLLELQVSTGDRAAAERLLAETAIDVSDAPTDLQLARATAEAAYLEGSDDWDGARRMAVAGIRLVAEQQSLLGAADLRIGLRRHAERLAVIGLSSSVRADDAALLLDWQERIKLTLGSPRPIRPPKNRALRKALAKLRAVDSEDSGQRRLREQEVRQVDRSVRLDAKSHREPVSLSGLSEALGQAAGVSLSDFGGRLIGTMLVDRQLGLLDLGSVDEFDKMVRSVRSDLRRRSSWSGRTTATSRVATTLERMNRLLRPLEVSDALALAPPPSLVALPWGALPCRMNRPTVVVTSLSAWAKTESFRAPSGSTVFVSGRDLEYSEREVRQLAEVTSSGEVVSGPRSTIQAVLAAIDGASVAHIVAHGTVRTDNPLFSSLRMADGDLSVYELGDLEQAPSLVVLSACHVGLPSDAPGQELLGMVTGFLNAGTSCVLASTLPVPDNESTIDMMTRFHGFLAEGMSPALAWAEVQRTCRDEEQLLDTATFTVFGRG